MKRRPTIPIDDWLVAVDLEETARVRTNGVAPARSCACAWCQNWRLVANQVIPESLRAQLRRLGHNVESPTDAYARFDQKERVGQYRIIYQFFGRILSGPSVVSNDAALGEVVKYKPVGLAPTHVDLLVARSSEVWPWTQRAPGGSGELLQIDIRASVPSHPSLRDELASAKHDA